MLFYPVMKRELGKFKSERVAQGGSVKKVLLEIAQNSQENTCARIL